MTTPLEEFIMSPALMIGLRLLVVGMITYCAVILIYPIIYPTIITYPWPSPDKSQNRKEEKSQTVVLAGSFNPPHNGHLAMLLYLSERFGKVIVVVGMNPSKKYQVTPHERADLVRRMLQNTPAAKNVQVEVVAGYIWRTVKPMGAEIFVRGIRSWEKDGADERNLQILNTWGPLVLGPLWWPLPTLFLEGKPEYNHISSTMIRTLCSTNSSASEKEELASLVPTELVQDVARYYGRP